MLFKDTVTEALADPASDDDGHNQVKMGQLKRNLRLAVREVEKTTPKKPKSLPTKKAAVKTLRLVEEEESDEGDNEEWRR